MRMNPKMRAQIEARLLAWTRLKDLPAEDVAAVAKIKNRRAS